MSLPSRSTVTRLSGRGRSSVESQKSIAWRAIRSSVHSGASFVSPGFSPRNIAGLRLADHLDVPERVVEVVAAEVEVVEPERLLERRSGSPRARARAPPSSRGTCSCGRPGRSRWRGRSGACRSPSASSSFAVLAAPHATTTMSPAIRSSPPSRSTTTSVTAVPASFVPSLTTFAFVSSVTFACSSAGRTPSTSASDLAWTRHGKPSQVAQRMHVL